MATRTPVPAPDDPSSPDVRLDVERDVEKDDRASLEAYYRAVAPFLDRSLAGRGDLAWWREMVARLEPSRVLELGCGTGRVTGVLGGEGRTVVGLDLAPAMLDRARERLGDEPGIHLVRADMRKPPVEAGWDLVAAPDDPFIHLLDDEDRQRVLDAVAGLLAPDGRLLLDLLWWTPDQQARARSSQGLRRTRRVTGPDGSELGVEEWWRLADDGRTVAALYSYLPRDGENAEEAVTATFRGRRWTLPELRRSLERAGLEVRRLRGGFDDRPFDPDDARSLLVEAGPASHDHDEPTNQPRNPT